MAKIARGDWQREILDNLMAGYSIISPYNQLRGRAKNYQCRYRRSFLHLVARMAQHGLIVERKPGVRGGEPTATYKLRKDTTNPIMSEWLV